MRKEHLISLDSRDRLFTITLTPFNFINFSRILMYVLTPSDSIFASVKNDLTDKAGMICRNSLSQSYIDLTVNNAQYIYFISLPFDPETNEETEDCHTAAFGTLLFENPPDLPSAEPQSRVGNLTIACASKLESNAGHRLRLGSYLIYQAMCFCKRAGLAAVLGHASSTSLLDYYLSLGYRIGYGELYFEYLIDDFNAIIRKNNIVRESKKDRVLYELIFDEIFIHLREDDQLLAKCANITLESATRIINSSQQADADYIIEVASQTTKKIVDLDTGKILLSFDLRSDTLDSVLRPAVEVSFDIFFDSLEE